MKIINKQTHRYHSKERKLYFTTTKKKKPEREIDGSKIYSIFF